MHFEEAFFVVFVLSILKLTVELPLNPGFLTTPELFESADIITSAELAKFSERPVAVPLTLICCLF